MYNDTLIVNTGSGSESLALRLAAGDPASLAGRLRRRRHGRAQLRPHHVQLDRGLPRAAGNDQFRVDQANGTFADEALTVDGGNGDDTFDGGDGVELFFGGSGDDAVDGNRGDDTALLGSGHDSFRWDPGDGSDVVEGDTGTDTLDFNGAAGAENMSLSPDGERSLFLRDAANIRMDMDNVEQLDLTALGGIDTLTVNDMSGTDFRRPTSTCPARRAGRRGSRHRDRQRHRPARPHRRRGRRRERRRRRAADRVDSPAARPSTCSRSTPWAATTTSTSTRRLTPSSP